MKKALLLSPLAVIPALILLVFVAFIANVLKSSSLPKNTLTEFGAAFIYAFAAPLVSYPATVLYGVPLYLLLRKYGRLNLYTLMLGSIVPAAIYGVLSSSLIVFLSVAYFSVCVAGAFWWLQSNA